MNERRREFAILRALGATRATIFSTVTLEGGAIGFVGGVLAFGVFAAIAVGTASVIQSQTGVAIDVWAWHPALAIVPVASVVIGALAGVIPALRAYRTDVAENLVPSS
jgi:putative ABC transport system permease protein